MHCQQSDERSGQAVFVSHCLLNANAKVCGLAKYPAMVTDLVAFLAQHDFGIIQLPCPELLHLGPKRWWQVRSQYDTPSYRSLCQRLAFETVELAIQYHSAGYKIAGLLGVEGSPSCGVEEVYDSPQWGGRPAEVDLSDCRMAGTGIFIEVLMHTFEQHSMDIPFVGIPSDSTTMNDKLTNLLTD